MDSYQTSLLLFDEHKAHIKGKLLHTIFHNPENMYSVVRIRILETTEQLEDKEIVIVGSLPLLVEEEVYTFWGNFQHHPRFGLQYKLSHFRKEMPQGKEGLILYLSSDLFPGIGKKTAGYIVEALGEKAIPLILENPAVLDEVPQLPEQKKKGLYDQLMEHQGLEQIMMKLGEYGIGLSLSVQIYQTYQERAMEVLQQNPYQLIEDIEGIGFKRADLIGKAMGIAYNSRERIGAACTYFLREQSEQHGHVYYPQEPLLLGVKEWLNHEGVMAREEESLIDQELIAEQVLRMGEEGKLILEDDRVYLPSLFFAEKGFAKKIKQLMERKHSLQLSQQEFLAFLGQLEERLGVEYAPSQKEAVEKAIYSSLLILTGGPGTGKTTVIKGVCELYAEIHGLSLEPKDYLNKEEGFPILLVAPTGRAAKRMAESTGLPAVTIHRLLGWKGGKEFEYSEDEPLSGRLLIIDETSMMDQWLANQLFRALPEDMQVILVGDQDQLPSVGPGQVLKDLIHCQRLPVVELHEIYRQAQGSSIITLAHQIKKEEQPTDLMEAMSDRRFFRCTGSAVVQVVRKVYVSALKKGYTTKDIQVLAPMYRGEAGIDALNKALQEELNPKLEGKREVIFGEVAFRTGDKVLQLTNNPEANVFNGDIGEIDSIIYAKENTEKEDMIVVAFEQNEVIYRKTELNQITLAYCCSVHKSQGSEFPIVIIPVVHQYYRMLKKNLIYTAITRSKDYLILCGEEEAFLQAIKQDDQVKRHTSLLDTLQEWLPVLETNPSYE